MTSKRKKAIIGIASAVAIVIVFAMVSPRKVFGTVTRTRDWADGKCTYRETCSTRYFFGISLGTRCNTVTINCP